MSPPLRPAASVPGENPTLDLMAAHRSIRAYSPGELSDELVRAAVAAAQRASTSSNVQAYSLLRIKDPAKRARLVELTGGQRQVAEAGAFFVVCADQRRHRLVAAAAGTPCAANLETFLIAVIDASLFAQNLALAFESLELGVCYVGGLRNELFEVDRLLELPFGVLPLFGLCAGRAAEGPAQRPRLPLGAVLFEDGYPDDEALRAQIADYDRTLTAHYAERGQPGRDWSGAVARKFRTPQREHLASYYASKGAALDR